MKIRIPVLSVLIGILIVLFFFEFPDISSVRDVNAQSPGGASGAAKQCRYCPPDFCYNPELARLLKKQLKDKLRHRGIPERLLVFVDRLPDCPACIRFAPRDFFIGWRIDPEVYERVEGVPAPRVTHGSTRWSRTAEKIARDWMKEGVYTEIHIIHKAGKPCECCVDTSQDSYTEWRDRDERPDEDHPNYDEDFESTPESMISYRNLEQLGPDPADLTEIPPLYRRPTDPKVPPADEFMDEPAMRFVQVICDKCQGLADRYNALGDEYNALRELLAELRQKLHEARQMATWIDREIQGLEMTIPSADKKRRMKELYDERNRYINDANRLRNELRTHETRRDEIQAESGALLGELKECEAGCLEVEKPMGLKPVPDGDIGKKPEKPVPDKEDIPEVELIDSKNISGNDPFDPRDPLAPEASRIGIGSTGPPVVVPPASPPGGGVAQPPAPPESTVLIINNIPIDRLSVAGPDACPSDHYHGDANNCDGVFTTDPAPLVCGHGIVGSETSTPVSSCPDL